MIISKELLSEVMGYKNPCLLEVEGSFLYLYKELGQNITKINIHELAHKCKEWAITKGFILQSSISCENKGFCMVGLINNTVSNWVELGNTEVEAICKAAQYVYDTKRIKL